MAATRRLLEALLPRLERLLDAATARRVAERQATWCDVVEEYWDDPDALRRHRERGGTYRYAEIPREGRGFAAAALDVAARKVLPSLVPSQAFFELRLATRQRLETLLREALASPTLTLRVFGSSANLFGAAGADLDMCAEILLLEDDDEASKDRASIVRRIGEALAARADDFAELSVRDGARVPIALFKDLASGLDCDVSAHNPLALRNTALLRAYASIDQRVRAVAYVVKSWAKARGVNSPPDGTLSSYGYVLCVLHYLQRTQPPLLPSLQELPPDWPQQSAIPTMLEPHPFEPGRAVDLYFHDPSPTSLPELRTAAARNAQSIGDLVAGFFEYFAWGFDYRDHLVSVRRPATGPAKKSRKAEDHLWPPHSRLAVEDPFEPWYDVAHVVKPAKFALIRLEFMRAHHLLAQLATTAKDRQNSHADLLDAADFLLANLCNATDDHSA